MPPHDVGQFLDARPALGTVHGLFGTRNAFTREYVCGELVTEVVGWLLAGLAIAKIVRPPFVAITPSR